MKKIFSLILSVLILCSSLPLVAGAAEARTGITLPRIKTASTSHPEAFYVTEKRFEELPITYEAWVYVPKSVHSSRCGIILGNYNNAAKDVCVSFEIYKNGVPRIVFCAQDGTEHAFEFNNAAVPADKWTHVAIVYDTAANNIKCYLNGVLKQTLTGYGAIDSASFANAFGFAGDCRSGNAQYFKGALKSVTMFSDVRTAEEIKADMSAVDVNADGLLSHYDVSEASAGEDVKDKSPNGYDVQCVRTWFKEKEAVTDYAYSFCVVGDTQKRHAAVADLHSYLRSACVHCVFQQFFDNTGRALHHFTGGDQVCYMGRKLYDFRHKYHLRESMLI